MSRPREVRPGRFYFITRRCSESRFLLRPDAITNNVFQYALAVASQDHHIVVLDFVMMSNHYHALIFDRYATYPEFLAHFHGLVARTMNTRWQRKDHFWSAQPTSVVWLPDVDSIIRKLVYIWTNPVHHYQVTHVREWPGAHGYSALRTGKPIRTKRPPFFFATMDPTMPATKDLILELPPELGDRGAFLARLDRALKVRLEDLAEERERDNKTLAGPEAATRHHWSDKPETEPFTKQNRNRIRPTYASKDENIRKLVDDARRKFLREYGQAREKWLKGEQCKFPVGTYWLATYAGAPVIASRVGPVVLLQ